MTVFRVIEKATAAEVWRYGADAAVEWPEYPFVAFDHVEDVAPPPPPPPPVDERRWRISVGSFWDRFGANKVPILADPDPYVQAFIKDCMVRPYLHLYERRADIEAGVDLLIGKGYALDKATILDVIPTEAEAPNG